MFRSEFPERLGGGGWGRQGGNLGLLPPAEVRDDGGDLFGVKLAQILGRRSKLKTTPDGARCRCRTSGTGSPRIRRSGDEGLQVGPVNRATGRRAASSLAQEAARVSPKSDIDSGELPSVGQPTEIDVRRTDDLHTLEVQQLAVEHIPCQGDIAFVTHRQCDQCLGRSQSDPGLFDRYLRHVDEGESFAQADENA